MFRKTRLALVVGCFTSGLTVSALAQDTPSSSSQGDTLVVTSQTQRGATKLETPDIETPQAVSIITRDQIQEQGATSVRQAVGYTPGVYNNQIGASNRFDYMVLRGFSDGSLDNVYLDGLKMMGDTNSHSSLVIDPWFLDSIEVVRGPASVLYGRSSPGGIVALNSRQPSFDRSGQIKLFAGNNAQRGAAFDVTGPLDGLTIGSGVRYVNGVTSDRANTHTLPSYTLVDMAVGYDLSKVGLKGLSAQLNVNNLTDKRYVAACNSLEFCYFGAERSVVGSVSYSF
ncbi:TonB-dependent receptor [Pectobacterium polaris]|uniref:TonB-dependent siderophore receptor n=1 Tax=Pectobacterium polaris TaxID=2042057 RepID=UPI000D621E30|nr:TonB-dependent receptor [Pectobacterium polaris]MCU1790439.1 TonB-dependent receptor [Pectobacterium polaris]PWD59823.1 hypothetical protein DF209_08535 [Pectobacterium polaris]